MNYGMSLEDEDLLDSMDDDETVYDTSVLAKSSLKLIEPDTPSLMKLTYNETNSLPSHIQPFLDLMDILQPIFITDDLVDVNTGVTNDDPNEIKEEESMENEMFCEIISESDPDSDIIDLTQDT